MARRRQRKKEEEEHVSEAWLLPYADLLTLLLALFIVLFASSEVDARKFDQISESFNSVFTGGSGINESGSSVEELNAEDNVDESPPTVTEEAEDQNELAELQERVEGFIDERGLEGQFTTRLSDDGLLLSIKDNILFEVGEAEIRDEALQTAEDMSELLVLNPPRNIIISGHTDDTPIANADFNTNWELSVMRAVHFMEIVLENPDLDPRDFSAKGFGEFEPVASNDTAEGRAQNRRVEVLILPRNQTESSE
ncbi:flagellar motor protein MotB [Marinococcus halophilus]|uniref:Motility protein B n=1 Tax=Marinococcus halophilus TaxID=1371 RepID=A0A510YA50_MARHA|nr:flagellar motor protein MotB [Marinococcus halophilus]OZT78951.1 flagellar motor protein MotB [Marinococcus halophilus]GEK60249.1 motility protein B [Marinococcus halophilus]